MRNLQLSTFSSTSDDLLKKAELFTVNSEDNDIYFITDNSLYCLKCPTKVIHLCIHLQEANIIPTSDNHKIVSLNYLCEQQALCLACETGDLVLFYTSSNETEVIGSVESGLTAAAWSPDGDVLVLITGHQTIILMTREFEPIREVPLFSDEFGENKPVTIGWGKKETQFHGSEGKTASQIQKQNPQITLDANDRKSRMTWRGDGQLFAISAVSPKDDLRYVYVFSRDGSLQSTSEVVPGMEAEICWRPIGNLIASVQRLPNKYQIIFLEKNGLCHGNFTLPFTPNAVKVHQLLWNSDSSLLAVWIEPFSQDNTTESESSEIQIWAVNNYHWYLKESLKLLPGKQFLAVDWLVEKPLILTCITNDGTLLQYSWTWTINRSHYRSDEDETTVAVIDGDKVLITPFRKLIVPPPEAACSVTFPSSVNQIIFPKHHSPTSFAVLLSDGKIALLSQGIEQETGSGDRQQNGFKNRMVPYSVKRIVSLRYKFVSSTPPLFLHHWVWLNPNVFLAVHTDKDTSVILKIVLEDNNEELIANSAIESDGIISNLTACADGNGVIVQFSDCRLLKYSLNDNNKKLLELKNPISGETVRGFPQACHCIQTCTVDGNELDFGLTDTLRLYCFEKELCNNCTSFFLHDDFVILTTTDHTLRCIPLTLKLLESNSVDDLGSTDNLRRVERGSTIVTCVRNGTQVLLQMPRGNLETIHPRSLILNVVIKFLDQVKYLDAFVLMRKHRINMNLICDHNLSAFLKNVDKFVAQIDNVNWINIFLTDLQDEDVTTTMYSSADEKGRENKTSTSDKVNQVHTAVRTALMKLDSDKFLLCVLTTYVLMKPPDLETALGLIKNLDKSKKDEALDYLKYLKDINDLYDVALGTYDFDLVVMVAQKSQKDPKEYLPFLNELRKMDVYYQRYTIDRHLKRPERALDNIVRCGKDKFDQCLTHIRDHNLYQLALKLYKPKTTEYKEVSLIYADYLNDKRKYEEAGLWYRRSDRLDLALHAFERSLQWQQALTVAFEIPYTENERLTLANQLAERLKDQRRHLEAAYVFENYVKNFEETILALMEGHCWENCFEVINRCSKPEFYADRIKSSILEHWKSIISNLENTKTSFERHVLRLSIVREEKKKKLAALQRDLEDAENSMAADLASEIGSVVSGWTQTTMTTQSNVSRLTSRNRRKQERKKQSLKEGNPFEENALVEALAEITLSADKLKDECGSLLRGLMWLECDKEAEQLQNGSEEFFNLVKRNRQEIWIPITNENPVGPNSTANSIALAFQQPNSDQQISAAELQMLIPPKIRENDHWRLDVFR